MKKIYHKSPLILLCILSLTIFLTGCTAKNGEVKTSRTEAEISSKNGSDKAADAPVKFRIGVDSGTFGIQFHVAKEKGFFAKYGIEPELLTFSYGIDTLNAALTEQVDVGEGADFAALSRFAAGDLKIISFIQSGKPELSKVVARDGINSPQDLKGKKFGVQKATVLEYILARYLDRFRIPQEEVEKVGIASNAELVAAFEKGDVKAAILGGSFLDKALNVKGAKVIGSQADIPFAARGFLVAREKFLKEKPEAAKRLLLALNDASKWINENPEGTGEIAFKAAKLPKEAIARDIKDITNEIRLTQKDVEQLKDVYEYATSNKLIKGGYDLKDKIEIEPLKEALPEKLDYDPSKF